MVLRRSIKPGLKEKMEFLIFLVNRPFQSTHTTLEFSISYKAAGYDNQLGNIPIPVWVGLPMRFFRTIKAPAWETALLPGRLYF
jgi:hypothetical protein